MNKYWPPDLILPSSSKSNTNSTLTDSTSSSDPVVAKTLKGPHFLRLGKKGGIELANTKQLFQPDQKITIEFWARIDPSAKFLTLVGNRVFGTRVAELNNQEGGCQINCQKKDEVTYFGSIMCEGGGGLRQFKIDPNEWSHYAIASDSSNIRFFVNGMLVGERKIDQGWKPGPLNIHIGFHRHLFWSIQHGFNGDLRAVRVSTVCRYSENFSPPSEFEKDMQTEVLLQFTDPTEGKIKDISGNEHDGTITGGQWMKVADP